MRVRSCQSELKLEGAGRKQDLVTAALGEVRIAWFALTAAPSLELVPVTPIEHVQHVGTHPEAEVTARVPALFKCNVELLVADASLRLERIVEAEITRSEEHTSELQSLMRISYAVFCLKKKKKIHN